MKDDLHHMTQIARFLAGEMTSEEQAAFNTWCKEAPSNQKLFEESKRIWALSQIPPEEDFPVNVDQSWQKLELDLPEDQNKPLSPTQDKAKWNIGRISRIAAVFLIGIMAVLWWQSTVNISEEKLSIHTQAGEKKEWQLPDGSKIWLNENTTIEYAASFIPRRLKLEGEAFFEVVKKEKQTFLIESGHTLTEVLGTAFNLRAYPEEEKVELLVESGKVAFGNVDQEENTLILQKGNAGVFDRPSQTLQRLEVTDQNAMAWKTEVLEFEDLPLDQVLPVLERYFGTSIKVENDQILNCHLTGRYESPDIQQMLMVLNFSLNLEIESKPDAHLLKGSGCEVE